LHPLPTSTGIKFTLSSGHSSFGSDILELYDIETHI
jgi:hypothetical protein